MEASIIIQGISAEELEATLRRIVREEITANTPIKSEQRYLTRKEASKRLQITLPTLTQYVKQGRIRAHRIGARVLFLEEDIQACLQEVPSQKNYR